MRKFYKFSASVCLMTSITFIFSSCATNLNGRFENLPISFSPSEATVKIVDQNNRVFWSGTTPATVNFKRGSGYFKGATYQIEISKKGYASQTVTVSSSLKGG